MKNNPLNNFSGETKALVNSDDNMDATIHDDHLLPFGCRSFDEWEGDDDYDLLGRNN